MMEKMSISEYHLNNKFDNDHYEFTDKNWRKRKLIKRFFSESSCSSDDDKEIPKSPKQSRVELSPPILYPGNGYRISNETLGHSPQHSPSSHDSSNNEVSAIDKVPGLLKKFREKEEESRESCFQWIERELSVKDLRQAIPLLMMKAFKYKSDPGLRKVKGIWEKPPEGWPEDVPYCDPNNGHKNFGKPRKDVLVKIVFFLLQRCKELNAEDDDPKPNLNYHSKHSPVQDTKVEIPMRKMTNSSLYRNDYYYGVSQRVVAPQLVPISAMLANSMKDSNPLTVKCTPSQSYHEREFQNGNMSPVYNSNGTSRSSSRESSLLESPCKTNIPYKNDLLLPTNNEALSLTGQYHNAAVSFLATTVQMKACYDMFAKQQTSLHPNKLSPNIVYNKPQLYSPIKQELNECRSPLQDAPIIVKPPGFFECQSPVKTPADSEISERSSSAASLYSKSQCSPSPLEGCKSPTGSHCSRLSIDSKHSLKQRFNYFEKSKSLSTVSSERGTPSPSPDSICNGLDSPPVDLNPMKSLFFRIEEKVHYIHWKGTLNERYLTLLYNILGIFNKTKSVGNVQVQDDYLEKAHSFEATLDHIILRNKMSDSHILKWEKFMQESG